MNYPTYPLSCAPGSILSGTTGGGSVTVTSACSSSFNGKSYYSDAIGCVDNCPGGPYMDYTNLKYDTALFDLPCRPGFKNITIKNQQVTAFSSSSSFSVLTDRCIVMLDSIDGNDDDPNFGFFRQFNGFNDGCNGCRGQMVCDPLLRPDASLPAGTDGVPCSTLSVTAKVNAAGRRLLALPAYTVGRTWPAANPATAPLRCGEGSAPYKNNWNSATGTEAGFRAPSMPVGVLSSGLICLQNGDSAVITGGSVAATQSTSDVRLKTNLQKTGRSIGQLAEYTWEWNELAKSLGVDSPTVGVIAQEAQLVYPAAVSKSAATGYLQVDYALLRELAKI